MIHTVVFAHTINEAEGVAENDFRLKPNEYLATSPRAPLRGRGLVGMINRVVLVGDVQPTPLLRQTVDAMNSTSSISSADVELVKWQRIS